MTKWLIKKKTVIQIITKAKKSGCEGTKIVRVRLLEPGVKTQLP